MRIRDAACLGALLGALFASASPAMAGGFALQTHGAGAAGMGGASVARATDPSMVAYNPGAVALLGDAVPRFSFGLANVSLDRSSYQGRPPGIGTGTAAEQEEPSETVPHAFLTWKRGSRARLALGYYSPFLLQTDWAADDTFAGRYSTTSARLQAMDLFVGAAVALRPGFGLGAGVVYRTSEFEHRSRLASFDPAAGTVVDVASQAIATSSDDGVGYSVGILHRRSSGLSWGASYRSAIEIDHSGGGDLTQIATGNQQLDELIAATLPFGEELAFATRIEFPDTLTVGLAMRPGAHSTVALDLCRTGWSGIETLPFRFANDPVLDREIFMGLADTMGYRLGVSRRGRGGTVWRVGLSLEESPLPDEALGAFFPDGDRAGYHLGVGWGGLDIAVIWTEVEDRVTSTSVDGLNGAYGGKVFSLVATFSR